MSENSFKPNGCGPEGFSDKRSFFATACNTHDQDYALGTPKAEADKKFLANMLNACRSLPWHQRFLRMTQAYLYYTSVKLFGWAFYKGKI